LHVDVTDDSSTAYESPPYPGPLIQAYTHTGISLNDLASKFTIMNSVVPIRERIVVTPTAHAGVFVLFISTFTPVHHPSRTEILDTSLTED